MNGKVIFRRAAAEKYLKLDAREVGARALAECLINSPCKFTLNANYEGEFRSRPLKAVTDRHFHTIESTEDYISSSDRQIIFIKLSTLVLCPFKAYANSVNVIGYDTADSHSDIIGKITKIEGESDGPEINIGLVQFWINRDELFLDLNRLPPGVELVEGPCE